MTTNNNNEQSIMEETATPQEEQEFNQLEYDLTQTQEAEEDEEEATVIESVRKKNKKASDAPEDPDAVKGAPVGKFGDKQCEFIEDLPGVGPATAQKLRDLGYHTVESLAMATIKEIEAVGVSEKKAFQIIQTARSTLGVSFVRADVLMKQRQQVAKLTTGCKSVDKLIAGGIETQDITEFYGEYCCGKSQVCHQLCVNVQLPIEQGGLNGAHYT
jgi:DNA repair protein RadA